MICKDCEKFAKFGNSDECGLGICMRTLNWQTVQMNSVCAYEPKPHKCKDCQHMVEGDTACLTANPEDDICAGFEDYRYYVMMDILFDWISRGKTDEECTELFTKCLALAKQI